MSWFLLDFDFMFRLRSDTDTVSPPVLYMILDTQISAAKTADTTAPRPGAEEAAAVVAPPAAVVVAPPAAVVVGANVAVVDFLLVVGTHSTLPSVSGKTPAAVASAGIFTLVQGSPIEMSVRPSHGFTRVRDPLATAFFLQGDFSM